MVEEDGVVIHSFHTKEMKMEPKEFLDLAHELAAGLDSKRAGQFVEILDDRAIWDQMAFRLSKYLRDDVLSVVDDEGRTLALRLLAAADSWLGSELDDLIYAPAREIARLLEKAGFATLGQELVSGLRAAGTGGEAVMGINRNLRRSLEQAQELPARVRSRIEILLRRLQNLEGDWVRPGSPE